MNTWHGHFDSKVSEIVANTCIIHSDLKTIEKNIICLHHRLMRILNEMYWAFRPVDNSGDCSGVFDVPQGERWGGEEGKRNIGGRNQGDQMNSFYLYNYHFYSKLPPHPKRSFNTKGSSAKFRNSFLNVLNWVPSEILLAFLKIENLLL